MNEHKLYVLLWNVTIVRHTCGCCIKSDVPIFTLAKRLEVGFFFFFFFWLVNSINPWSMLQFLVIAQCHNLWAFIHYCWADVLKYKWLIVFTGHEAVRCVSGVDRWLCSVHIQCRRQKRAAALERLGHAQHQQPQLSDPEEIMLGRCGLFQKLHTSRRH